jgi:thiamine pyrophosphate-dependent acetolactate synthase large subunit-like protein
VVLESPRGVADATIGAFTDILRQTDLIVLLGKALDFTLRWAEPPVASTVVRIISIDPDGRLVVNSVTGAIGAGLPFALAARFLDSEAPIFAIMGRYIRVPYGRN